MAVPITGKELKAIKNVIDALNEAFPPNAKGVLSQKWKDNKLISFRATIDKHFTAYKVGDGWSLICDDYYLWHEATEYLDDFCTFLKEQKINCYHGQVHPVFVGQKKNDHKKGICFFIGEVTWC